MAGEAGCERGAGWQALKGAAWAAPLPLHRQQAVRACLVSAPCGRSRRRWPRCSAPAESAPHSKQPQVYLSRPPPSSRCPAPSTRAPPHTREDTAQHTTHVCLAVVVHGDGAALRHLHPHLLQPQVAHIGAPPCRQHQAGEVKEAAREGGAVGCCDWLGSEAGKAEPTQPCAPWVPTHHAPPSCHYPPTHTHTPQRSACPAPHPVFPNATLFCLQLWPPTPHLPHLWLPAHDPPPAQTSPHPTTAGWQAGRAGQDRAAGEATARCGLAAGGVHAEQRA